LREKKKGKFKAPQGFGKGEGPIRIKYVSRGSILTLKKAIDTVGGEGIPSAKKRQTEHRVKKKYRWGECWNSAFTNSQGKRDTLEKLKG